MPKCKAFAGIETDFFLDNQKNFHNLRVFMNNSLLDYDCVVVNATQLIDCYRDDSQKYNINSILLSEEQSERIKTDFYRIKSQLTELLQQGKNIFVLLGDNPGCYVWERHRNGKDIKYFSSYSFLPIDFFQVSDLNGKKFEVVDPSYGPFFEKFRTDVNYKKNIWYRGVSSILKVNGTERIVSGIIPYEKGRIIFLPYLSFFSEYDHESCDKQRLFVDELIKLENVISLPRESIVYPEWIDDYNILSESEDFVQLLNLEKEKIELQKRIDSQKSRLELLKKYKGLFTSTGHQLENIVKDVLAKLGFEILPSDSRRSDVIAKYQNQDIVAEVKGVKKSATEEYARQLEAWNSDFWRETKRVAKCILIVNGFMDKKLEERNEPVFPDPMLKYCIGHEQCLISTTQLLCLFIEITENPECKDERINELLTTVGVYNRYPDYTKFIKKVK